jgi:hypothetical protein
MWIVCGFNVWIVCGFNVWIVCGFNVWIVCVFKNYELYLFFLKLKKSVGVKAMYDSVGSWCLKKVQKSNILFLKV